ncbi:MAG: DUF3137 domain-containing protein [Bacteroidetes bacterium]|nr:MAG: DUF3137 domain-containing protein [Bacteroidota bacterium]
MNRFDIFRIYYNQTIHPELVRLDRLRLRLLRLLFFSAIILAFIILIEIMINLLVVTLFLMIPIGLYMIYLSWRIRKFRFTFKPRIVELLLDFIDDDPNFGTLKYKADQKIPLSMFMESGIFGTRPAVYEGEDYIAGRYGEFEFEMSELNVREFSKVRNRLNYVFRGVFLHARLQYDKKGELLILPRDFRQYLVPAIKKFTAKGGRQLEPLAIQNPEFREEFLVYLGKHTILKNILSKEMQSVIMEYVERADKYIYISFKNRDIYIAVTEPKDILEPKLFQSNVSFELVREFFEDINMLIQIVEDIDRSN